MCVRVCVCKRCTKMWTRSPPEKPLKITKKIYTIDTDQLPKAKINHYAKRHKTTAKIRTFNI